MNSKFISCYTIIIILSLLLTGCWDRRELDELAVVSGMAIDIDKETNQIKLTAQIIKAGEVGKSQGGAGTSSSGKEAQAAYEVESTGNTIFDAIRNFTLQTSRKLYFPHNNIIIFSNEVAKEGLTPFIDFFIKDPETRNLVWVLVAEKNAGDILHVITDLEKIPASGISKLIKHRTVTSQIAGVKMEDFISMLLSPTTAPVATYVKTFEKAGEKKVFMQGTSFFKGDRLVGQLDKTETRGLLWIKGKVKSGILVIKDPQANKISMEITKASSKIKPEISQGNYNIKVQIYEEGNIGEEMGNINLSTTKMINYLEEQENKVIKREIESVLKKAREYNTDIFAFGEAFHRKYPDKWKEIEAGWEAIFPKINVELEVSSHIKNVGLTTKPPIPLKQ